MATQDVVLCSPVRTAIGAYNGSLKTIPAPELGAAAVRETLKRSGLDAAAIGSVFSLIGVAARYRAGRYRRIQNQAGT